MSLFESIAIGLAVLSLAVPYFAMTRLSARVSAAERKLKRYREYINLLLARTSGKETIPITRMAEMTTLTGPEEE